MKKRYNLPIIPEDLILFIDNSAFNLDDYKHIYFTYTNDKLKPLAYLRENRLRLEKLARMFSRMDNWTTITEVVEEFEEGNEYFLNKSKKIKCCRQLKNICRRIFHQREKILELLKNNYRLADHDLTDNLTEIINKNEQQVEAIFKQMNGVHKNRKTDTKLINIALAYATQEPVCIFTNDIPLLKTYIACAKKFGLFENSYVLADKFHKSVKTANII